MMHQNLIIGVLIWETRMHFSNKKILITAAHPDDEVLGAGGTINRLSKNNDITLVTFTDGESSRGVKKNRNSSLVESCKILGIKDFHCGDFPDNEMDSVSMLKIVKFLESKIKFVPDLIFTHNIDDLNVDHTVVSKATITCFRPQDFTSTMILSYYVPSSTEYNPSNNFSGNNMYFRLRKKQIRKKHKALMCYDKEMRKYPHSRSYKNIINLNKCWGSEVGCKYAEKFKFIRGAF